MIIKRIVCLANSKKRGGRCVAGIELVGGKSAGWLRPVSRRPEGELTIYEQSYEDGTDPQPLDIVDIPLIEARPKHYQTENWLIESHQRWTKIGRLPPFGVAEYAQDPAALWLNGRNTLHGVNDHLTENEAHHCTSSLFVIRVDGLRIRVLPRRTDAPESVVQALFDFGTIHYALRVTDLPILAAYATRPAGTYVAGPRFLTVSLGEPFNGACYKIVAAILPVV